MRNKEGQRRQLRGLAGKSVDVSCKLVLAIPHLCPKYRFRAGGFPHLDCERVAV